MFGFGSENGRVDVAVNHEMWESLHSGTGWNDEQAIAKLKEMGIRELRAPRYHYSELEIDYVRSDPLYSESARTGFLKALDLYRNSRRLPPRIRLEFHRPQTRDQRDREAL